MGHMGAGFGRGLGGKSDGLVGQTNMHNQFFFFWTTVLFF